MIELFLILTIITAIALVLGVFVLYFVMKKKIKDTDVETDYRVFFILGICFLPMGIIFMITVSPGFAGIAVLGVIYVAIGLYHKDKWK